MNRWAKYACILSLAGSALLGQHSYSAADLEDGARLYQANCSVCHGPEGDQVSGVDLARGKFLTASSDDDLTRIIVKGIPGTPMPAANFPDFMVFPLVAYVRSMSTSGGTSLPAGDAARGKLVFESQGKCLSCHRVKTSGSRLGPDLTDIGGLRRVSQLERALVNAAKEAQPEYRSVRVVTKSGAEASGRLLNVDTFTVQRLDSQERLRSFLKSDLREYAVTKGSTMPSYKDRLTSQELADVVSYLASLKGANLR